MAKTFNTIERNVSELATPTQALIKTLLDGDEPTFCYEIAEKETGLLGYQASRIIVITEFEIIELRLGFEIELRSIVFLSKVDCIKVNDGLLGSSGHYQPEIHIIVDNDKKISVEFGEKQEQVWAVFLSRLRRAIKKAKKAG